MGWQTDDGEHEGWGAAEFPDGRLSVGSGTSLDGTAGVLVRYLREGLDTAAEPEMVDGRTAIGWRGVCECGWRGALWERAAVPLEHADAELVGLDGTQVEWAARKVFEVSPSKWADAPTQVDDAIYQEWRSHLPLPALDDVRAAAEDLHKAEAQLAEAVARARADGSSWADVGAAAGITRQSAHERWARR